MGDDVGPIIVNSSIVIGCAEETAESIFSGEQESFVTTSLVCTQQFHSNLRLDNTTAAIPMAFIFRRVAGRAIGQIPRAANVTYQPTKRSFSACTAIWQRPAVPLLQRPTRRHYSAPAGLGKDEVEGRIKDLMKNFDKAWTRSMIP